MPCGGRIIAFLDEQRGTVRTLALSDGVSADRCCVYGMMFHLDLSVS